MLSSTPTVGMNCVATGCLFLITGSRVATLPRSPITPPSSGWHGDLLEELEFIENPPHSQSHAGHVVLSNPHGELGFPRYQPVQPPEEATTAGDDDARIDDVRGQFWGGLLETSAYCLDDGRY